MIVYSHHSFTALLILILKLEFRRQPNCRWKVTSIKTPGSSYNRRSDTHNLNVGKHHSLLCTRTRAFLSEQPIVTDVMCSGICFGEMSEQTAAAHHRTNNSSTSQNKQQQHITEQTAAAHHRTNSSSTSQNKQQQHITEQTAAAHHITNNSSTSQNKQQ